MTKDVKIGLAIGLVLLVVLFVWLAARGGSGDKQVASEDGEQEKSAEKQVASNDQKPGPAHTESDGSGVFGESSSKSGTGGSVTDYGAESFTDEGTGDEGEDIARFSVGDEGESSSDFGADSLKSLDEEGTGTASRESGTTGGESTLGKTDETKTGTDTTDSDAEAFLKSYLAEYGREDTSRKTEGTQTASREMGAGMTTTGTLGGTTHLVKPGETLSAISKQHYGSDRYVDEIMKANGIEDARRLPANKVITIPSISGTGSRASTGGTTSHTTTFAPGTVTHVVKPGENPSKISMQYYKTPKYWREILEANGIEDPSKLIAGKTIIIPDIKEAVGAGTGTTGSRSETRTLATDEHRVKDGETLTSISKQHYGTDRYAEEIQRLNNIEDPRRLRIGQILKLPDIAEPRRRMERAPGPDEPSLQPGERRYTVKESDTLVKIAANELGNYRHYEDIQKRNHIADPTRLRIGQVIILPDVTRSSFLSTSGIE